MTTANPNLVSWAQAAQAAESAYAVAKSAASEAKPEPCFAADGRMLADVGIDNGAPVVVLLVAKLTTDEAGRLQAWIVANVASPA